MLLPDDDELHDIDQTYLGPPGRYVSRMRYRGILVGPILFLTCIVIINNTVGYSLLNVGLSFQVSAFLTGKIVDNTSAERPLSALLRIFGQEITSKREDTKRHTARGPRRLPVRVTRERVETRYRRHHMPPIGPANARARTPL